MTQQEYDQKKRECWEEFCRANPSHNKSIFARKVFDYAFDRAYALGKETETITQEDAEKAWQDYAKEIGLPESLNYATKSMIEIAIKQAFKAGAKLNGKQEKDAEEAVIQGWVFVDEATFDRHLCVRQVTQGEYEAVWDSGHPEFCLGEELFPDMVPGKLPEPVEIIIKRKKNG